MDPNNVAHAVKEAGQTIAMAIIEHGRSMQEHADAMERVAKTLEEFTNALVGLATLQANKGREVQ